MASVDPQLSDVRDVLDLLRVSWRSPDNLRLYHLLAEKGLRAVVRFAEAIRLNGTSHRHSEATIEVYMSGLVETVAEIVCFPDSLPADGYALGRPFEIWGEWWNYRAEHARTGVRRLTVAEPWSIRDAVLAAWNIEFAQSGLVTALLTTVGDSAHRTAMKFTLDYWAAYFLYENPGPSDPQLEVEARGKFYRVWNNELLSTQAQIVRMRLTEELRAVEARLFGKIASEPRAVATATIGDVHVHNRIVVPRKRRSRRGRTTSKPPPCPPTDADADAEALLTPRQIADRFNIPFGPLQSRLKRWRVKNPDGWVERANRSRREAAYMFKLGRVRPIIDELVAATSQRPAR